MRVALARGSNYNGSMSDASGQPVIVVVNPYSGTGSRRALIDQLDRELRSRGFAATICWGLETRQTALNDRALLQHCRCIVVAGGDGTLSDTINTRPGCPVAVLPAGNENLFARQFGFSRDVVALVDTIARGKERRIDLGRAGDLYFSLMVSAGFDADVVHRVAAWRQATAGRGVIRRIRRASYVLPTIEAIGHYDWPPITLETDRRTITGAIVMVFNAPPYARCRDPLPHSDPADGLLDWIVFKRTGPLRVLQYDCLMRTRRLLDSPHVEYGQSRCLQITSDTPVPVQCDGEATGHLPINVRVEPAALRVMDTSP